MFIIKALLKQLFLVFPLRLIGIFYLLPVCAMYKMGEFPRCAVWFDDFRGRKIKEQPYLQQTPYCLNNFGLGHCKAYNIANNTFLGRYIWLAWRNTTNMFKHTVLGEVVSTGCFYTVDDDLEGNILLYFSGAQNKNNLRAQEYSRINGDEIKIPFTRHGIRVRIGHKINNLDYVKHMAELGIPLEFTFSLGLRKYR